LDEIRFGKLINTEAVKDVVKDCVTSVLNNPNALLLMTQMQSRDDYTSQHSFDVCVLSIAFGRHLGFPEKTLQELGLCGLLRDMGKMKVSLDLLNKKGQLEAEEFELMKQLQLLAETSWQQQETFLQVLLMWLTVTMSGLMAPVIQGD
jgi:HD-GYP domain-containing protein (c-di-GMP phosphodiesterase class II)